MWLFLPIGFFSIVKKRGPSTLPPSEVAGQALLTVRSRVAADLDNLRTLVPGLSETVHTPDCDYPFRATVSPVDLAIGLGDIIQEIEYDNFKAEVARRQGHRRAAVYAHVWAALRGLAYELAGSGE